ncbi:DUF362 domain-containing protein [Desulfoplanes sp.]
MTGIDVFLARADDYKRVESRVFRLLDALQVPVPSGGYILIKPNLISSRNASLSCTHPQIVRSVARYFLDRGCSVVVGDSPAFGSARKVASSYGLLDALRTLDLRFVTLDHPVQTCFGPFTSGISKWALDAALVVNLPKLKAHCQMRVSAGVKNLFGTVCGFRKPLIHFRHGDRKARFPAFFVHLMSVLPRTITLMDGITAMHRTGPTHGEEFAGRLLGAAHDTVALDTAVYTLLGLGPKDVFLWQECVRQGIPGAFPENLSYPLETKESFAFEGFEVPKELRPQVFGPKRLVRSLCKRLFG